MGARHLHRAPAAGGAAKGKGNWFTNEAGFGGQTLEFVQEKNGGGESNRLAT